MLMAMLQEGFDISDPGALATAQEWFNGLSFERRGEILGSPGPGPGPGSDAGEPTIGDEAELADFLRTRLGSLPPVSLPTPDELDRVASDSVWWQRVRGLCDYVGPRLAVTNRGNLKLADGRVLVERLHTGDEMDPVIGERVFRTRSTADLPVLDLVYELALSAGFLELDVTRLRPRPADLALLEEHPHEALQRMVLLLMTEIGVRQHWTGGYLPWLPALLFDEHVPVLLADLYGRPGVMSVADLVADQHSLLRDEVEDRDLPVELVNLFLDTLEGDTRKGLALLAEFAVLEVGPDDRLSLTPFGTWSVHQWLSQLMDAPALGTLRDLPAAAMLRRASDLPEEVAVAEVDAWLAAHSVGDLAAAVPSADETGQRLAVGALARLGPSAVGVVEVLGDVPGYGELAEVWRAEVLGEPVEPTRDAERFVRLLAAVHLGWGPRVALTWAPRVAAEPLPLVETAWRVRLPQTADVLTALVESPDKALSKAARRSLFKLRSLGPAGQG
jgi:hypothetical protein